MQVCGYAGLRYAIRRWKGIRHMALWFSRFAPSRGFVVFTPYADKHTVLVPWFLSHPMPLRISGLRFVEVQVPWIAEDHGSVLECWRLVLSAAFVSLEFV